MTSWTDIENWIENREISEFIFKHSDEDINSLAFSLSKRPLDERNFILNQIRGGQKAKHKFPTLEKNEDIVYPTGISIEQSSSEEAAIHKASNQKGSKCVDLTCGFGIDSLYLSEHFEEIHLVEQNELLLNTVKHNFNALGVNNATFHYSTTENFIDNLEGDVDLIYIDPSRRNLDKKVFLIEDSSPNLLEILPVIRNKSKRVLVKLSPMLDLSVIIRSLPDLSEIEVVSVDGECKEILVSFDEKKFDDIIQCTELGINAHSYKFSLSEEKALTGSTGEMKKYTYLPSASVVKAGAFKNLTKDFDLDAISLNTHIYTSSSLIKDFPGRKYECLNTLPYNKKELKKISDEAGFNIVKRNFRDDVNRIAGKLNIRKSGDLYLFCYNDSKNKPCLSICRLIDV